MTKQEIIIKAWIDLNISPPFGICNETGWYHGYFCNGINDIESEYGTEITNLINYDIDISGVGKFRPKSLDGIETNNNWIKIESEADLPDNYCEMFVIDRETKDIRYTEYFITKKAFIKLFSHYQPIKKPQPPIY